MSCSCAASARRRCATRASRWCATRRAPGRVRRHVPPLLFLIALTLMLIAIARPAAVVTLPSRARNRDPRDGRIGQHARDRRQAEPDRRRAGGGARVRRRAAEDDADRRRVVRRDGVGRPVADAQPRGHSGRDRPLPAAARHRDRQRHPRLAEDDFPGRRVRPALVQSAARGAKAARQGSRARSGRRRTRTRRSRSPPGSYTSAAIILLTDGQTTTGPDPIEAARMAADRGVRVYTVGIGTTDRRDRSAPKAGRCACASTRSR